MAETPTIQFRNRLLFSLSKNTAVTVSHMVDGQAVNHGQRRKLLSSGRCKTKSASFAAVKIRTQGCGVFNWRNCRNYCSISSNGAAGNPALLKRLQVGLLLQQ